MNDKITDTVLLFGRSPFINSLDIPKLLSLGFTTIGINEQDFKTDYVAFVDEIVAEQHKSLCGTLITLPHYELREPTAHFGYYGCDFTHDYVLNWLHGRCSEVVLIGCADFCGVEHYNSEIKFEPPQECIDRSISFIESITDFKVYKMNSAGLLNIPVKTL